MTPLEKLLNRSDKTEIKKLNKIVDEIDALEEKISSLNDEYSINSKINPYRLYEL